MKEHNIDLNELFDTNREILILKNEILVNNYNKVKNYNIDLTNENIKYLLYNKNALRNIDYYIEAKGAEKGFLGKEEEFDGYDCIVNNPYKLNNINRTALLKLRYATENNHKIFSNKAGILSGEITNPKVDIIKLPDNYIDSYFNNEYQSISSSELERLMQEFKNLKEIDLRPSSIIEALDNKYKVDDLRYSINNLIFSRLKTISLYNFLTSKEIKEKDALLIALTYNSVIKKDEFTNIEKTLEGGN